MHTPSTELDSSRTLKSPSPNSPPPDLSPSPTPAGPSSPRRRGRPRGQPLTEAELAARRANIRQAHAAPREVIYRPTERRQAASRRNIQRAIAARRSAGGNSVARLNAFKHGLAAKGDLRERLGEAPQDFAKHHELVRQVFRPRARIERQLVERLAEATWGHMRTLRAQARLQRFAWRRLLAQAGPARRLSTEEVGERAYAISRLLHESELMESKTYRLRERIECVLAALIRERARREKRLAGDAIYGAGGPAADYTRSRTISNSTAA